MSSTSRQPEYHCLARIQKCRSAPPNRGRGCRRGRTTSCCRKHMFSATSSAVGLRRATIAQGIQRITNPSCLLTSQRECSIPSDTPEEVFAPYRELVEVVTRIARALI